MIIAGPGPTYPDAGVIATSPATAPLATPSTVGLPPIHHSATTQVSAAAEAPRWVATNADTARPLAASDLPALNPNHPTHSNPAPVMVIVRLCGCIGSRGEARRFPAIRAAAGAGGPRRRWNTA